MSNVSTSLFMLPTKKPPNEVERRNNMIDENTRLRAQNISLMKDVMCLTRQLEEINRNIDQARAVLTQELLDTVEVLTHPTNAMHRAFCKGGGHISIERFHAGWCAAVAARA